MNKYGYKARNWEGKIITGLVEARDLKEAVRLVKKRNLIVVDVKEQKDSFLDQIKVLFSKVSGGQIASFTRRLATMVEAGLPLTDSLEILERQESGKLKFIVKETLVAIQGGTSLSNALEIYKEVFGDIYISSLRAGEAAGVLDKVLLELADNLEKKEEFFGKVKGAMIYPIIIVVGMIGVIFIVMTFVIPKLTGLYKEFGTEMPLPTRILMFISDFMVEVAFIFPILIVAGIIFFKFYAKRPNIKAKIDRLKLKLPIIGPLNEATLMTDISRTLAMLISTGVPLIDGVQIIGRSTGNILFEKAFKRVSERVEKGFSLSDAMREQIVFPDILVEMVATGEQTGKLDKTLANISHYFEVEAEQRVKTLTSAIEPLIMIVLGVGVGFLVFAVIMPIYSLTSQF